MMNNPLTHHSERSKFQEISDSDKIEEVENESDSSLSIETNEKMK